MGKKSYRIRKKQKIEDIIAGLSIKFLSMRVEASTREGVEWIVGLIDNETDKNLNYITCESNADAQAVVNELILKHSCIKGEDIGNNSTIVYFSCEDL